MPSNLRPNKEGGEAKGALQQRDARCLLCLLGMRALAELVCSLLKHASTLSKRFIAECGLWADGLQPRNNALVCAALLAGLSLEVCCAFGLLVGGGGSRGELVEDGEEQREVVVRQLGGHGLAVCTLCVLGLAVKL